LGIEEFYDFVYARTLLFLGINTSKLNVFVIDILEAAKCDRFKDRILSVDDYWSLAVLPTDQLTIEGWGWCYMPLLVLSSASPDVFVEVVRKNRVSCGYEFGMKKSSGESTVRDIAEDASWRSGIESRCAAVLKQQCVIQVMLSQNTCDS